jgi:hypothetical protein
VILISGLWGYIIWYNGLMAMGIEEIGHPGAMAMGIELTKIGIKNW